MNLAAIAKLTDREKFQLMEALWEDMRKKAEEGEIPEEHKELLDERQLALDSGDDHLLDWDRVKHSLRDL